MIYEWVGTLSARSPSSCRNTVPVLEKLGWIAPHKVPGIFKEVELHGLCTENMV